MVILPTPLAWVARLDECSQLDVLSTGDQEVAGSTPTGLATFFYGDLIMKYFLQSFSPFH